MPQREIELHWLENPPEFPVGVSWGVPWRRGELDRKEGLTLRGADGGEVPLQSRPAAYWPDGSVKWTLHAASFTAPVSELFRLAKGEPADPPRVLRIAETGDRIEIDTGRFICCLGGSGTGFIRRIEAGGKTVCSGAGLLCLREEISRAEGAVIRREETCLGAIERIALEERGPLRAVVRCEGKHALADGRSWLPFILRLYFHAGLDSIKLVHTFVYDGNPERDWLKGLGLAFRVPMAGPLYNRRVALAGDTGFFAEAAQFLSRLCPGYAELYPRQAAGEMLAPERLAGLDDPVQDMAAWDDFQLYQDSADHHLIRKRTKPGCAWVEAAHGRRSPGLAYVGGETGGLAAGVRDFWQKHPSALEVSGLSRDEAELRIWLWPPEAGPMDLRSYDTETHTVSSYEGAEEFRGTPFGIANTNELDLHCFAAPPALDELVSRTAAVQAPPRLVCDPRTYHEAGIFGVWSLSDRSTPAKARLEDKLTAIVDFYRDEVERRRWYGFWHYGDLMHTYDPARHAWKYDTGGYAWQNAELAPNMWLWYSFLRTGRPEIFRLAEAMTRHTSEVDTYHSGPYAGLGSRHNVVHWGCGCKEARISMAGLHRFYYYLTGDERTGEIMDEVKDADFATAELDPMRAYFKDDGFPTHARSGPDWAAFCSNWLTRWERFEDEYYRDKLLRGLADLKAMPFGLRSGPTFGYDPATGRLHYMGEENYAYHMVIGFGAVEIWLELERLLNDPGFTAMLAEFGAFYNLSPEEKARLTDGRIVGKEGAWAWPVFSASLAAFAAARNDDRDLALLAWRLLLDGRNGGFGAAGPLRVDKVSALNAPGPVEEIPWLTTNSASIWSLRVIQTLALVWEYLEEAAADIGKLTPVPSLSRKRGVSPAGDGVSSS